MAGVVLGSTMRAIAGWPRRSKRSVLSSSLRVMLAVALVGSVMAVASSSPAAATDGASSPGGDVPVICGWDTLDNGGTSSVFGSVFVPAGATVKFTASGEILPSTYWGSGRGEYTMWWRVYDGGVPIAENYGFNATGIVPGPTPYPWQPFSGASLRDWYNNTGTSKVFGIETWAQRTYAGAGIHYSVHMSVPGGTMGSCNQAVAGSEFFGPNPAMPQQCPSCHGSTDHSVDTFTGNEHWELPGLSVPGRGPGLDFRLAYNSLGAGYDGSAGRGWRHSYDMALGSNPDGTRTVHQETGSTVTFAPVGAGQWDAPGRFDAELVENGDGTWVFVRNQFEHFTFGADGRLAKVADRNGEETTLVYAGGLLDYVEDAAGRRLDFSWSGGRIATITDTLAAPAGPRTIRLFYNSSGDLNDFRDAAGGQWRLLYDSAHRLTSVRAPRHTDAAKAREFHYDAQGRVDWEEDALNRRTTIHYDDPVAGATRVVDPDGDQQVDWYNALGQRVKATSGYGTADEASEEFAYDPGTFMLTSRVDGRGHEWTHAYGDAANPHRPTLITDPLGRTRGWAYNALGQVVSSTDGEGVVSTLAYDANGNLEFATVAVGTPDQTTTDLVRGDPAHPGDVTSVVDGRGKTWHTTYDPATGDRLSSTDPEGNRTTWEHNAVGWVTGVVAPAGNAPGGTPADHRTLLEYNRHGDATRVTNPLGQATTTAYDANRNVTLITEPDGDVTWRTYTDADELASETVGYGTPAAATTTYAYRPDGALQSWSRAGSVWSYGYDPLGRQITATDPNGQVTSSGYDQSGNLLEVTQPGGTCDTTPATGCIRFAYDDANQLTSIDYSDPATPDVTSLTYDDNGRRLTDTVSGQGTSTSGWDARGQLSFHTDHAGQTVGYDWDPAGNLTGLLYPGQVTPVTYDYDDSGRMSAVTDWLGNQSTFDYDPNSNLTSAVYPTDTSTTDLYTYDRANRVDMISWNRASGGTLGSLDYQRDPDGLVTAAAPAGLPAGPSTFGYDTRDQLTAAGADAYRYDTRNNIIGTPSGVQGFNPAGELDYLHRAITVVGTTKTFDLVSSTINQPLPPGIVANDQILFVATIPADQTVTAPPAGYTVLAQRTAPNGPRTVVYRRAATGGETAASITFSGLGPYAKTVMVIVYRGVDPTDPIAGVASNNTPAPAGSITVESMNLDRDGVRVAMIESATGNLLPSKFNHPTGMANQVDVSDQLQITTAIGDKTMFTSGPTGALTATYNWTSPIVGVVVAFNPERHTYTYDPRGNRTGRTTPYTSNSYAWDQANRLVSVDASTTYRYDADGLRIGTTSGSGATQSTWSRAPGPPLLLTETPVSAGGALVADQAVAYIYGPGGRVLTRIDPLPEISVVGTGTAAALAGDSATVTLPSGVSADDQILLSVTHGNANSTTANTPAGYTDVATRNSSSSTTRVWRRTATGGESSVTVTFNSLVTVKAAVAIVYRGVDPNNPIVATDGASADATTQITVPSLTSATEGDRLLSLGGAIHLLPGTTTWTAPANMTLRAQVGASSISAAVADQPLTAVAATGTRTLSYATNGTLTGVGVILRRVAPPERWHHSDQLGSTRLLTDEAGDVVGTATYDAYGNTLATTGETSRLSYTGEYTDPTTGLIYLRARWYDPATAQFLTRDPLEAMTQDPYGYAANNPVNYTDPTGLFCIGGKNPNGSCRGSGVVDTVKDHADDASAVLGGVALACTPFAWTGVGAACAGIAGSGSMALSAIHTTAECLDDGFLQAECGWSAAQTALSFGTFGTSNAVRGWGGAQGPILGAIGRFGSRFIDFGGYLTNTGISLERTGWYDEDC